MIPHDKAAGLAGLGGSVDKRAVRALFYRANAQKAIAIDDGSSAVAKVSSRYHVPLATAFEVCRLAGLGVR